jgi:leucyl-tRNA synthetase
MDGFACSSWYFLRFASPDAQERPFDPEAVRAWLPVDTYVGGAEHAVMHLLYARFWTKVMYDAGLIDFVEPFQTLRNQGVLHAADGQRMSKSKGNVVTPDEVVEEHGTDALRTYIVFIGPFEANVTWDERGIKGVTRFLDRFWMLARAVTAVKPDPQPAVQPESASERTFVRQRHRTIRRVTDDMIAWKFNTAVAALMEWLNYLVETWQQQTVSQERWREAVKTFTLLLAPIAPFITEEVWQAVLGHEDSVHRQRWPSYEESALEAPRVSLAVQVNGRVRDTIDVAAEADKETITATALASANVRRHVAGRPIRRTIFVPGRLINLVV